LRFAAGLVALGDADGLVAGVSATTAEVLDAARWAIGAESGLAVAALVGYLTLKDRSLALAFGVAGAETAAAELAAIGGLAVRDWTRLQDDPACVAFLSAGTHGSVATVAAERVRAAAGRFREQHPEIKADGEVDLWAALQSGANVLVFPNHDAGHLAWQLARWLGAECMGPLVRGVSRPVGALSRDAALDDIVVMAALVAALGATAQTEVKR
jgi:phosphate acetyltransferase